MTLYGADGRALIPSRIDDTPNTGQNPDSTFSILEQGEGCDALLDFGNDFRPQNFNETRVNYAPHEANQLYTAHVEYMEGLSVVDEKFLLFSNGSQVAGCHDRATSGPGSFFCLNPLGANGNRDYYLEVRPGELWVSPNKMWFDGGSTSRFINEAIPDDGWIWPYHASTICTSGRCEFEGTIDWTTASPYLLMPVDGVVKVGSPFTKEVTGLAPLVLGSIIPGTTANDSRPGLYDWTESWLTLKFRPGGSLVVRDGADFTVRRDAPSDPSALSFAATNAQLGWKGIQFNSGSSGTINGSTITGVKNAPIGYAVRAYNAQLEIGDGTLIDGAGGQGGIYASGSTAGVLLFGGATLQNHTSGYGLNVSNGAHAFVTGDATTIQGNASGGIRTNSYGDVTIVDGNIVGNPGPGAVATAGGSFLIRRGWNEPGTPVASGEPVNMSLNIGGVRAETAGEVITCGTSNDFVNNGGLSAPYDVFAFEWSLVDAENSYWGHQFIADVGRYEEDSSVDIDPVLPDFAGSVNNDGCGIWWKGGEAPEYLNGPAALHASLTDAAQLRISGRAAEAADLIASALAEAESEAELGSLVGAAVRLVMHTPDAQSVGPLKSWADRALMGDASGNQWAQRVSLALATQHESTVDVQRLGEALLRSEGERGPSHRLFALRALVGRAVRDGQEGAAREWLATARSLDAGVGTDLQRFVDVAFQEDGSEPPRIAEAGGTKRQAELLEDASGGLAELLLVVSPNPARAQIRVEFRDDREASVEESSVSIRVFDTLGRAVLAQEGLNGGRAVALDTSRLPIGLYTVRAVVDSAGGANRTATARFTIVR